jgi:hypothetical protein
MLVVIMLLTLIMPIAAAPASAPVAQGPDTTPGYGVFRGSSTAVKFDISPPLRDIVPLEVKPGAVTEIPERATGLEGAFGPQDADAAVQTTYGPSLIPAPIVSFNGPGNISGVSPPDPVGDVGPNHYVAMSNLSFQIFDKLGNSLYGPALNNTLWAGFGGACQTNNSGDPIVLHDQIADRWMLSQFTSSGPTYFNCVAVSQTSDPTGAYYRWAFSTGSNFPDYPKYGWWSDALYISTREFAGGSTFAGIGAYAVKRADLISGNPAAQVISFLATPASAGGAYNIGDGLLPSDLDGSTLPPAGSPNYFMGSMDNGGPYGAPQDALTLWKFTADFVTPANSSFVLANTIPIAAYDTVFPCTPTSRNCIPQPGTANKIDILSYRQRPTHRLAYRNFGTHESLVTNQSVEAATSMAGIRWWEVRSPNSNPVLYQDSTYAPGTQDTIHRWMASVAMDNAGNMALGYSASNGTTTYPSSWYTGRLAADPLNTMPQGEGSIINGTGSQTGSGRWGDYTSMNVDPVDDCTFWYVNEWVPTTSSVGWQLRIGAFKFPSCGGGGGASISLVKTVGTTAGVCANTSNITVPQGTTVYYCYTVTNTGNEALGLHTLTDNVLGTIFTGAAYNLAPGASVNTVALGVNVPYVANANTTNVGTWTAYNAGGAQATATSTANVNVVLPRCPAGYHDVTLVSEGFEGSFPPAGWVVANSTTGCVAPGVPDWTNTDPGANGNLTGGSGLFAIADSDECGSGVSMNAQMWAPVLNLNNFTLPEISFKYDYNDFSSADSGALDLSTDGGSTWSNINTWSADDRGPATYTSAFTSSSANTIVRWHYIAGWDWWWEVDDVTITACEPDTPTAVDLSTVDASPVAPVASFPWAVIPAALAILAGAGLVLRRRPAR